MQGVEYVWGAGQAVGKFLQTSKMAETESRLSCLLKLGTNPFPDKLIIQIHTSMFPPESSVFMLADLLSLKAKFEDDKKKVAAMKAARRFKPV